VEVKGKKRRIVAGIFSSIYEKGRGEIKIHPPSSLSIIAAGGISQG